MRKTRFIAVAAAIAAVAAFATSASAATSGSQVVTGTTLGTLALGVPATPAVLDSGFAPGQTATNTTPAAIVVTSTSPSWTLTASDPTNNGHLVAAALGCTGSEAQTANQLQVQTSGTATNSASPVTIAAPSGGGTGATVATGSLASALTAQYSLAINPLEQLLSGCAYSTTVNWTVQ